MARSRYYDPTTGNEILERVLDNVLPSRKRHPGMSAKKKGQTSPSTVERFFSPAKFYDIYKDRETNQLFILEKYEGEKYESALTSKDVSIDKTGLFMYMAVKPLFYSISVAAIESAGAGESINIGGTSGNTEIYGYRFFNLKSSKTEIPTNTQSYNGQGNIAPVPRYLTVKINGMLTHHAISSFDGTAIELLNPICINTKLDSLTLSVNIGNFIYANAAVVYDQKTIFIGTNDGIWKCVLDSEKNVIKKELAVSSNSSWIPMMFQIIRENALDKSNGCLYMTAMLNTYLQFSYTTDKPGWRFSNFTVSSGDFGYNPQTTNKFGGVVCIFKFDLEVSKIKQETYSIIYSHIGGSSDPDFTKEITTFWGKAYETTTSSYRNPKIYDDQNLHTVKMKQLKPEGGTPGDLEVVDASTMLGDFNFGVDSLIYKFDTTWLSGMFFKKTERPYIEVFDATGNKVRNILITGFGFPVDSLKLRCVGITQTTKKLPTEPLGEGELTGGKLNMGANEICVYNKSKFIRGDFQQTQYGHYMFGVKDSSGFLLKSWDSYPFYTGYYFNRNMYTALGGDANWGTCCVEYMSLQECGEIDPCYATATRYDMLNRVTNPGITVNSGSMKIGIRFPIKYWENVCCGGTFDVQAGSWDSGCEIELSRTPYGYTFRNFLNKYEKYYFLDSLTSNHVYFNTKTSLESRKLEGRFYEALRSGSMAGKIISDTRHFPIYGGPRLHMTNNPTLSSTEKGITVKIKATDAWEQTSYIDWTNNRQITNLYPIKTFEITMATEHSPFFYQILYRLGKISLWDRQYIVGSGDNATPLRDYIESLNDNKGKALQEIRYNEDFLFNASIDWAIYSPVGLSDIFPQQRSKYKGNRQLSGKSIYEGCSFSSGSIDFPDIKAKTIYGGSKDLPTGYTIIEVTKDVTFLFTSLMECGAVRSGPWITLEEDETVYTMNGTIVEKYILIQ
jgi:hypothetical protein